MRNKLLKEKVFESLSSVIPITAIVLLLSITIVPLESGMLVLFLFGAMLLVLGMGLFTLGIDMSLTPMGEGIGVQVSKAKKIIFPLILAFILGIVVTVAEPDLQVLAELVPIIPNNIMVMAVAVGVGVFLMIAFLRTFLKISLKYILTFFYAAVFILAFFVPQDFLSIAFDSGGVTTGPITVPFIMALGVGLTTLRSDKHSTNDSFGLVAISSIGPILSVMILGLLYDTSKLEQSTANDIVNVVTTKDAAVYFSKAFPEYIKEVAFALAPILVLFVLFQLFTKRYNGHQLYKMIIGFVLTFIGLALFLTGVNIGFMPVGQLIGAGLATSKSKYLLIPVGMIIGYFIVSAEPAVHVLKKQVDDVSKGRISQKAISRALSIGVAISVGISMVRIITGIPIMAFLLPGYVISIVISYFVPKIYTGIAFDSGGVASGAMASTFLLPFAMGACQALGGNIMTDAFGSIALVAMTPLITIQLLGLRSELKHKQVQKKRADFVQNIEDTILYLD
ncbi:DUF1538 domain-containing protein [Eubacteriales bacterium OttesenSCG-928-G02]|nr:DUF1538 domain-containing protein [Eubacteriales bacterium OttesenSCG-928-G02]